MPKHEADIVIVGAGIAGIATAYYLGLQNPRSALVIVDFQQPMSFTSAHSGENYRNWWPHPTMVAFTNRSIDLMEQIARETNNVLHMTRRGYVLVTREHEIDELVNQLYVGYGQDAADSIRIHNDASSKFYQAPLLSDWEAAPEGVDVIQSKDLIRHTFPSFDNEVANVLHIRRAGDISSQQMGQFMLERIKECGGRRLNGRVVAIEAQPGGFKLETAGQDGTRDVRAEKVCIAAGPFNNELASMIGVDLPCTNIFQQKIAFEDRKGAIPRQMPFAIDLDEQQLDWTPEERELLAEDSDMVWLVETMPGGVHCRPDGGDKGTWVRLGWAFNQMETEPTWEPELNPQFPEIVLRAAARLNPALKGYYGQLPSNRVHYGGYYTMTKENWPLVGPLGVDGIYVVGALSGFGTMAACGAGELCASWILDQTLPSYAQDLSPSRYEDEALITGLHAAENRGIL